MAPAVHTDVRKNGKALVGLVFDSIEISPSEHCASFQEIGFLYRLRRR